MPQNSKDDWRCHSIFLSTCHIGFKENVIIDLVASKNIIAAKAVQKL